MHMILYMYCTVQYVLHHQHSHKLDIHTFIGTGTVSNNTIIADTVLILYVFIHLLLTLYLLITISEYLLKSFRFTEGRRGALDFLES